MTLDPVHVDGIAKLAGQVRETVETSDQEAAAEEERDSFLDPLWQDGTKIGAAGRAAPPEGPYRGHRAGRPPFPTQHGRFGVDLSEFVQIVIRTSPRETKGVAPIEFSVRGHHRTSVHSNDATLGFDGEWQGGDRGYAKRRVLDVPQVDRYEQRVVHALALYLAESRHALTNADVVEDLFTSTALSSDRRAPLGRPRHRTADLLAEDDRPETVVNNYVDLVERFVERDVPMVGFVKTLDEGPHAGTPAQDQRPVGERHCFLPPNPGTPRRRGRAPDRLSHCDELVPLAGRH